MFKFKQKIAGLSSWQFVSRACQGFSTTLGTKTINFYMTLNFEQKLKFEYNCKILRIFMPSCHAIDTKCIYILLLTGKVGSVQPPCLTTKMLLPLKILLTQLVKILISQKPPGSPVTNKDPTMD